jgi:hypothetical protein
MIGDDTERTHPAIHKRIVSLRRYPGLEVIGCHDAAKTVLLG